jgi:hypothetical protein
LTTFQPASANHWSIFILAFSSGVIFLIIYIIRSS